jgi:hypothetical protein
MKPTFALDLSRDAIALLHRNPKGWLSIGEVAFDAPDLDEALDYLRKTALGLSPMGMACKIILPNSQILYTEVTAPGPSRNEKRRQIAAALEGRTPYPVEDLVFDWSGKGATVKVAVVARETLDEAEGFAATHRLNPVSFVAIPPEGSFVGEAWFGPTAASETLLAPGEVVDRDREPVSILHRELPVAEAAAVIEVASVVEAAAAVAEAEPAAPELDSDLAPLPGLEEALNADLPAPEPTPESPASEPEPTPAEDPAELALAEALADVPPPAPAAYPAPEPAPPAPEPAPLPEVSAPENKAQVAPDPPVAPEVEEAPFAHVTDVSAFPDEDPAPSKADDKPSVLDDDIPPAPPSAAIAAFASRRSAADGVAGRPVGPAALNAKPDVRPGQPIPRPTPPKSFPGPVTAPSIPGTRAKPKNRVGSADSAAASLGGPSPAKSPARPGGTFGTAAPPRNRTGVVFMVLVALLLVFLAVIAAWSSMWLSRNGSTTEVVGQVQDAPLPDVEDEMLADMQDPEGMTEPLPEAEGARPVDVGALATEDVPVDQALEAPLPATEDAPVATADSVDPALAAEESAPAEPTVETAAAEAAPAAEATPAPAAEAVAEVIPEPAPVPAPEPAPDTAIATDVTAAQAPVEDQDEIFLAAMDAPPPALDALALPTPAAVADTAPDAGMPPPAFGTVYRFDANGLVMPTPEGILSPEGVFLIAGSPPLVPPSRSEAATAAALAAVPAAPEVDAAAIAPDAGDASLVTAPDAPIAEPAPSDPAMAGFRPRPRPEGLAPATDDDAALATDSATAVVGLRPLARPESVITLAAASRPAEAADLGAQGASLAAQAEASLPPPQRLRRRTRRSSPSRAVRSPAPATSAAQSRLPSPPPSARPSRSQNRNPIVVAAAAAPAPVPDLKPDEQDEIDEPDRPRPRPRSRPRPAWPSRRPSRTRSTCRRST